MVYDYLNTAEWCLGLKPTKHKGRYLLVTTQAQLKEAQEWLDNNLAAMYTNYYIPCYATITPSKSMSTPNALTNHILVNNWILMPINFAIFKQTATQTNKLKTPSGTSHLSQNSKTLALQPLYSNWKNIPNSQRQPVNVLTKVPPKPQQPPSKPQCNLHSMQLPSTNKYSQT